MSRTKAYLDGLLNYSDFKGRTSRNDYWGFLLYSLAFFAIFVGVDYVSRMNNVVTVWSAVYCLFALTPTAAISVRRLHDQDRSAAWMLLSLIPILGTVWFLHLMTLEPNKHQPAISIVPPAETQEEEPYAEAA